jgi:hypothetical protein
MIRRTVVAILWLFAVAWGWNLVAALAGLPSATGLALGLGAALLVLLAPPRVVPLPGRRPQARPATDAGVAPGAMPDRI